MKEKAGKGGLTRIVRFCLENRPIVLLIFILFVGWGLRVVPFEWDMGWYPQCPEWRRSEPDSGEAGEPV